MIRFEFLTHIILYDVYIRKSIIYHPSFLDTSLPSKKFCSMHTFYETFRFLDIGDIDISYHPVNFLKLVDLLLVL